MIPLLKEHYLDLSNQDEIRYLSYFVGQKYRVIENLVKFNGFSVLFIKYRFLFQVIFSTILNLPWLFNDLLQKAMNFYLNL